MSNVAQLDQVKTGLRKTPNVLYTWAGAIIGLLAISALLSFLAVQAMTSSGDRIVDSTGPVVISTQGLVASIAEADAANTAVFLSGIDGGVEDVSQRRLFESALARAPQQIEDISAGIGDDDVAHDALKEVALQLTEYSGVVERARLGNANGLPGADAALEESLALTGGENGMLANANNVTDRTFRQFDMDSSAGRSLVVVALAALVLTLVVLVLAQIRLRKLTNRFLNVGLGQSTILVIVLTVWLAAATIGRTADLDTASEEVTGDISTSASLQSLAFLYKTQETNAIIREDPSELPDPASLDLIDGLFVDLEASADSNREAALVTELETRWNRYITASGVIAQRVQTGNFDLARAEVGGEGNQTFNGFNTTLEALVLTNQEQFDTSVNSAASRLPWLSVAALLGPFLAAVAAWLGYRPRIGEYF